MKGRQLTRKVKEEASNQWGGEGNDCYKGNTHQDCCGDAIKMLVFRSGKASTKQMLVQSSQPSNRLNPSTNLARQGWLQLWMAPIWPQLMCVIVGIVQFVSNPWDAGGS